MKSFTSRLKFLWIFCLVLGATLIVRAGLIQLVGDPRLAQLSKRQFQGSVLKRPSRGTILDRNGESLAINVETRSLAVNPLKVQNRKLMSRLLARSLDVSPDKVLTRLKEKREFAWIKRDLSDEDYARMRRYSLVDKNEEFISGLFIVNESKRVYPHRDLASQVLGDVNLDLEGVEGIELLKNDLLKGKVATVRAVKDALGRPTFLDAQEADKVQDGSPIELTLDVSLQYAVEQELDASLAETKAKAGVVIVMNAMNGEILALANRPSVDPNQKHISRLEAEYRRNRVFTDTFEPGSTLKPILLASALSHGWRLGDRLYGEKGSFEIGGYRITEAEVHERFEWLTMKEMIQKSSNIVAAKLALRLGADRYYGALRGFGFGEKTGSEFPGEMGGKVRPRKEWKPITLANIGFGHGLTATPIQMARAYSAFLNGGWLVTPTLIKEKSGTGDASRSSRSKRILGPIAVEQTIEALRAVMADGGTGGKARVPGYQIAGKTGTAQVVDSATGKYSKTRFNASFAGFALGVEPKLVIFTMLEEPIGLYYASDTAAPLFARVFQAAANRFSIPATNPEVKVAPLAESKPKSQESPLSATQAAPVRAALQWKGHRDDGALIWSLPNLTGKSVREALLPLQGKNFEIDIKGSGIVKRQIPEPGAAIHEGQKITLELIDP